MDKPSAALVSCVMVTGKDAERSALALRAIESFRRQTYAKKELTIINHGQPLVFDARPNEVQHLRPDPPDRRWSIGELRNFGLDAAHGSHIAPWDDDDWSHPDRLQYQWDHLHRSKAEAVTLLLQLRYSFIVDSAYLKRYDNSRHGTPNTILHARTDFRYPAAHRHEDSNLAEHFRARNKLLVVSNEDRPELYTRFYHGRNVWDHRHVMGAYAGRRGKWNLTPPLAAYLRDLLDSQYGHFQHDIKESQ